MTVLEEAKEHLATYGAAHTECCGTPLIRKLVAELEAFHAGAALGIAGPLTMKPDTARDGAQPLPLGGQHYIKPE